MAPGPRLRPVKSSSMSRTKTIKLIDFQSTRSSASEVRSSCFANSNRMSPPFERFSIDAIQEIARLKKRSRHNSSAGGRTVRLSYRHRLMRSSAGQSKDAALNDFRYAADDPLGKQCPLGAHIRRANPRDTGGRREARRHRILRRGISYGGPLLKEGVQDDGEKRGLLFVAANSRIDLQFEVIQGHWINGGEFLGQSGLGRCPLTANHSGATSDSFLKAGASAPITGLPRFVTTRGGDYFFAPGIEALREISNRGRFAPDAGKIPDFSMGDVATPALLDPKRLRKYGQTILSQPDLSEKAAIHVELPSPGGRRKFCFIGQHRDVAYVLKNGEIAGEPERPEFSVRQYRDNGRGITRGSDFLVGTEEFVSTAPTRKRLRTILEKAWSALAKGNRPGHGQRCTRRCATCFGERSAANGQRAADRSDQGSGHSSYLRDHTRGLWRSGPGVVD